MARRKNFSKSSKPKRKRTAPHNIADEFEREKHKKELENFLSKLNEDGTPKKLLTESQIMGIIRGAIREKWMYAPNKLAYLMMGVVPDDDPNTRRRWKVQCEECEKWFKKDEVQVDHEDGENSLKTPEDVFPFYDSICNIGFDSMNRLCEDCHSIKTFKERYNITDEDEIRAIKKAISFEKENPKADTQKKFLRSKGFSASDISNSTKRRESLVKYFKDNPTTPKLALL